MIAVYGEHYPHLTKPLPRSGVHDKVSVLRKSPLGTTVRLGERVFLCENNAILGCHAGRFVRGRIAVG